MILWRCFVFDNCLKLDFFVVSGSISMLYGMIQKLDQNSGLLSLIHCMFMNEKK